MVVKNRLEAVVEPLFLPASYGYRPKKSALDAVGQARQRCWAYDWVCDLDIQGFFDNLDHDLMMRAVKKHVEDVISPLLANLFLHTRSIFGCGEISRICRSSGTRTIVRHERKGPRRALCV